MATTDDIQALAQRVHTLESTVAKLEDELDRMRMRYVSKSHLNDVLKQRDLDAHVAARREARRDARRARLGG